MAGAAAKDSKTTPPRFERAARIEDLAGEGPHVISVVGVDLVALRTRSGIRVYEGRCPHQGALLGEGEVDGAALVCRNHRWRFDVETGRRIGGKDCLRACESREEGGELLVDVGSLTGAASRSSAPVRSLKDLPGPRGLPLLGNALQIDLERFHLKMEEWARTYGPIYLMRLGTREHVVISDPALAEQLARARPETYRRPLIVEEVFEELRVGGVFSVEGDAWRAQRRLAMAALSQRHLRGFYPTLTQVAERLLKRWGEAADSGREVDMIDELKRFTVDVTTQLVFGHDLNTLEKGDDDVLQRHLEHVFPAFHRRLNAIFPYWRFVRLPADRKIEKALREVYAWLTPIIDSARSRLASDPARADNPSNFIEAMLATRGADGEPFSNAVIFGNSVQMLLAGEDTTANTLAWAVHHLCDNAEAVAALQKEAQDILGDARVPSDLDQANRFSFAMAVANESMRLRPVAPMLIHEPNEDVVVGDVAIPKGKMIVALLRPSTSDPKRFHQPEAFAPERWIDAGASGKAHDPSVHVPFGSGPRVCPGRTLAMLEMRVVLASVYKAFEIVRVGTSEGVRESLAFAMAPKGLRVKLRRLHA